ncbi:MAG: hypothetical protein WCP32_01335 [Bacteroidota bacterium]
MKNRSLPVLLFMMLWTIFASAQSKENVSNLPEKKTPLFGINFSGFVNSDIFFDTRQTVMARDGEWLFYPENIKPDAEGHDINAKGTYNFLSIQTRITSAMSGPDIFGAKISGLIEAEFYGNANANINSLRLRHAYIRLNWTKTELQLGQYWHPMFVPACAPEVVTLTTGAPFLVFCRNPQIRLTQQAGRFKFILTAIAQLDVTSNGPDGPSPKYIRNSMIPEGNFQIQYGVKNDERQSEFLIGASVDYLVLTPRLNTEVVTKAAYDTVINNLVKHYDAVVATYATNAKSPAFTVNFFTKLKLPKVTMKLGGVYGQDCYAFNMIGGYAVKSVTDPTKGTVDYAQIATGSVWGEFKTNGAKWQTGIYGGYSKNLGAGTDVTGPFYSRGANIDYLYRITPRLILTVKKLKIGGEIDYTVAAYGATNKNGSVSNSKEIGNLRLLIGVYYYF